MLLKYHQNILNRFFSVRQTPTNKKVHNFVLCLFYANQIQIITIAFPWHCDIFDFAPILRIHWFSWIARISTPLSKKTIVFTFYNIWYCNLNVLWQSLELFTRQNDKIFRLLKSEIGEIQWCNFCELKNVTN